MTLSDDSLLESPNQLAGILLELRKSVLWLGGLLVGCTVGFYALSPFLLNIFQNHLHQKLAFFTVAEPFLAHVKIAFFLALFTLMPVFVYLFWKALARPFGLKPNSIRWFAMATCVLFYAGASFCYFITLPFGVDFLLSYQSQQLKPVISIGKFITFVTIFILAFGVIFELPVFMVFSAGVGVSRRFFERNRRYAILAIAILAALLTPTPDAVNMALMGCPLYFLYEAGILVIRMFRLDEPKTKELAPGSE